MGCMCALGLLMALFTYGTLMYVKKVDGDEKIYNINTINYYD
jgi:hypothetical protein